MRRDAFGTSGHVTAKSSIYSVGGNIDKSAFCKSGVYASPKPAKMIVAGPAMLVDAVQELVAELGAAFTVGQMGMVDATIENHAAYLESWIKVLKSDKGAIFAAASQASKASDFILSRATQPSVH